MQKLSTIFPPQTDGPTKRENSIIEKYLQAFVNLMQDNLARFLSMPEFAYNDVKNASTNHILFKLNCNFDL